jgi:nucleoside diphosphate kinase
MRESLGMMWPKATERGLISRLVRSMRDSGIRIDSRERAVMIPSFLITDQTPINAKPFH